MQAAATHASNVCGLWIWRKGLVACVAAHAVTNAGLAFYVRTNDTWGLWQQIVRLAQHTARATLSVCGVGVVGRPSRFEDLRRLVPTP